MNVNDYHQLVYEDVMEAMEALGAPMGRVVCLVEEDLRARLLEVFLTCERRTTMATIKRELSEADRRQRCRDIAELAMVRLALDKGLGADLEMTNQAIASPDIDPGRIIFRAPKAEAVSDHGFQIAPQYQFSAKPQSGLAYRPVEVKDGRIVDFAQEALAAMQKLAAVYKVKNNREWVKSTAIAIRDHISELEEKTARLRSDAAQKALDDIAKLCGCERWEYPGQVVRDVEQAVAERDELAKLASDRQTELSRLRNELAAAHERERGYLTEASKIHRQLADIERRVAGGEAGPSAVAQAPGYERGPRIVAQSQYDLDE